MIDQKQVIEFRVILIDCIKIAGCLSIVSPSWFNQGMMILGMRYKVEQMIPFHCKRSHGCSQCDKLREQGEKWCVLRLFPGGSDPPVARPLTEIGRGEEKSMVEFEFVGCFNTEDEARSRLAELL